ARVHLALLALYLGHPAAHRFHLPAQLRHLLDELADGGAIEIADAGPFLAARGERREGQPLLVDAHLALDAVDRLAQLFELRESLAPVLGHRQAEDVSDRSGQLTPRSGARIRRRLPGE